LLTASHCAGYLENRKMIENKKIDCIDSLIFGLNRTAHWRKKMATQYPSDPRNGRAAECLVGLATDATKLSDNDWSQLKPHCGWASEPWREAISQTARMVGFKNKITGLPSFVSSLIGVLQS
jgi:hypothetical protein